MISSLGRSVRVWLHQCLRSSAAAENAGTQACGASENSSASALTTKDAADPDAGSLQLNNPSSKLEVIFIDEAAESREELEAAFERRFGGAAVIYTLERHKDGIAQITAKLRELEHLDAIHLVAAGREGSVRLGNTQLKSTTLPSYAGELASWAMALNQNARLLFYGCKLEAAQSGRVLLECLTALTGAELATSMDPRSDLSHRDS